MLAPEHDRSSRILETVLRGLLEGLKREPIDSVESRGFAISRGLISVVGNLDDFRLCRD